MKYFNEELANQVCLLEVLRVCHKKMPEQAEFDRLDSELRNICHEQYTDNDVPQEVIKSLAVLGTDIEKLSARVEHSAELYIGDLD